jgi:hypothetical protein
MINGHDQRRMLRSIILEAVIKPRPGHTPLTGSIPCSRTDTDAAEYLHSLATGFVPAFTSAHSLHFLRPLSLSTTNHARSEPHRPVDCDKFNCLPDFLILFIVSYLDPFLMYDGRWSLDVTSGSAQAVANASLSVSFYGTAIYLQGEASLVSVRRKELEAERLASYHHTQNNYSVVLDGAAPVHHNNAIEGTIFAQDQLTAAHHTLIVNAGAGMLFESMVVTTGDGDSRFAESFFSPSHMEL